jgi:hypothetical protein
MQPHKVSCTIKNRAAQQHQTTAHASHQERTHANKEKQKKRTKATPRRANPTARKKHRNIIQTAEWTANKAPHQQTNRLQNALFSPSSCPLPSCPLPSCPLPSFSRRTGSDSRPAGARHCGAAVPFLLASTTRLTSRANVSSTLTISLALVSMKPQPLRLAQSRPTCAETWRAPCKSHLFAATILTGAVRPLSWRVSASMSMRALK